MALRDEYVPREVSCYLVTWLLSSSQFIKMFKFEELRVYKEAIEFANLVYTITKDWPKQETYSLIDQLRRAAISIALNIAEGSSRTKIDFNHFLSLARGSCYECVAILTIARDQGYIDKIRYGEVYEKGEKIARMISALKISIR